MNAIRTAALAAALSFAAALPAPAMTAADLAGGNVFASAPVDFGFADQLLPGAASRLHSADAETARAAAESYFDYDALISLGALALAGGALATIGGLAGRRRKETGAPVSDERGWRESVFRAIQADLAQFTDSYRRAA